MEVPKISFVDDILDVTECGKDTVEMNEFTRNKINERKLQLNADKCVKMHIDKRNNDHTCKDDLKIDVWETKKEVNDSNIVLVDEYKGEASIKTVTKHIYLGDTIDSKGTNKFTIEDRVGKAEGISRDILHILEDTFFGDYYVEALKLLRNSMVISVLTHNIEVAHNLTKADIRKLDKVDMVLLQKAMGSSSKVSRSLLLLDLGLLSVEHFIKQKRIMFLFHLLTSEESSISKRVLLQQTKSPMSGDWVNFVKEDLKEINLNYSFSEISEFPKSKFKVIVKNAIKQACFESLLKDKAKLSKGSEIKYDKFQTQSYLKPGTGISSESMRWIFVIRSRDLAIRGNFPNSHKNVKCVIEECSEKVESQRHLFSCCFLDVSNEIIPNDISYDDIISYNVKKKYQVMEIIQKRNSFSFHLGTHWKMLLQLYAH